MGDIVDSEEQNRTMMQSLTVERRNRSMCRPRLTGNYMRVR